MNKPFLMGLVFFGALSPAQADDKGIDIQVYGDIGLDVAANADGHVRTSYRIGDVDLFLRSQPTSKIELLTELMFMIDPESGATMFHPARAYVGHRLSPASRIRLGRFHTPLGWYSVNYPHGGTIFRPGIARPQLMSMAMGKQMIPNHLLGAIYDVSFGEDLQFKVDLAVANSNGNSLAGDDVLPKAVALRLRLIPEAMLDGLDIGISGYFSRYDPSQAGGHAGHGGGAAGGGADDHTDYGDRPAEQVAIAHIVYNSYPVLLIAEGVYAKHSPEPFDTTNKELLGGFVQGAYSVNQYTPFVRFEAFQRKRTDTYYEMRGAAVKRVAVDAGLRYDLHPKNSFKVHLTWDAITAESVVSFQNSFAF